MTEIMPIHQLNPTVLPERASTRSATASFRVTRSCHGKMPKNTMPWSRLSPPSMPFGLTEQARTNETPSWYA